MNVEALSRAELLTLLSILEGELEAQDVVIHALRVSWPLIHTHWTCVEHVAAHLTYTTNHNWKVNEEPTLQPMK